MAPKPRMAQIPKLEHLPIEQMTEEERIQFTAENAWKQAAKMSITATTFESASDLNKAQFKEISAMVQAYAGRDTAEGEVVDQAAITLKIKTALLVTFPIVLGRLNRLLIVRDRTQRYHACIARITR